MATEVDYYQILGLQDSRYTDTLTTEEVKRAYRRALLLYHPDKQHVGGTDSPDPRMTPPAAMTAAAATIDDIALAYKVLSDPVLRAEYDRKVSDTARQTALRHQAGMEAVDLDDLDFDEGTETWLRTCRCGSVPAFVVTEPELEANVEYGELVVGCKGCSLWLKVLFSDGT